VIAPGPAVSRPAIIAALLLVAATACGAQDEGRTIELRTLNDSGVSGTAVLTELGNGQTQVTVEVEPGDYPDMPAHIHPGTCTDLVPQPRFPLENVVDGESVTEITATFDELFAGDLALNLHASSDDWETYTACAELTD
jgi:hypothetical protein